MLQLVSVSSTRKYDRGLSQLPHVESRKHFQTVAEDNFLRSISMDSALDMLMTMHYTHLRFIIIIIIMG